MAGQPPPYYPPAQDTVYPTQGYQQYPAPQQPYPPQQVRCCTLTLPEFTFLPTVWREPSSYQDSIVCLCVCNGSGMFGGWD